VVFRSERDLNLLSEHTGLRAQLTKNRATGRVKAIATIAAVVPAVAVLAMPAGASAKAASHAKKPKGPRVVLVGSGSSAAQPYMLALFAAYSKQNPNVKFLFNPDGGNAGITDVQNGRSEFAIQTAAPTAANSGTTFNQLFLDALCVDVNSSNTFANATLGTVSNIYLGTDNNWSQVGGSNLSSTIDPIGRPASAGLYTIFKAGVLNGANQSSSVNIQQTDGEVANAVAKDPNGIGYVGLSHSTTKGQKPISLDGVPCTVANVKSQKYELTHWDYAVLPTTNPNPQVEKFVKWIQTNKTAGQVANKAGAVWVKGAGA
jgi:phosphate transport system substrate-binding protein